MKGTFVMRPRPVFTKPISSFDIFATAAANAEYVTAPEQVEGVDLVPSPSEKEGRDAVLASGWQSRSASRRLEDCPHGKT